MADCDYHSHACPADCPQRVLNNEPAPNPPDNTVTIDDITVGEIDVSASGISVVRRCGPDCEIVDLVIRTDENTPGDYMVVIDGWLDEAGVYTTGAPPFPVTDCDQACCGPECVPTLQSWTADQPPAAVLPYNSLSVFKPDCCTVTVTTNAGSVVLGPNVCAWSPDKFDCPLDILTITTDCDPSLVSVIAQNSGAPCP